MTRVIITILQTLVWAILLSPFALLLLGFAVFNVPIILFGTDEPCRPPQSRKTAANDGEREFAIEIERLCTLVIAEREEAHQYRYANSGLFEDSFSVTMPVSEFSEKMENLGFECKPMANYEKRIGCSKEYWDEHHKYTLGFTFVTDDDGNILFYHGQSSLIPRYL